ncbi:phosphonate transport system permease protein [Geodermatophilus pulveris]|uniref:Phosphonate transport system permease protein n=1 Tax=Geodermatophilus pulveris TaxID=1564159 RepID=A0A239IP98_9ACTN|nr:ABC transporter permease subunit [Geodermatophilus pulveris]SNS95048.1 phosphonate transport system permease protein [Geodermatophilus pulveris]
MTATLPRPVHRAAPRLRRDRRRWAWGLGAAALLVWSLAGAGSSGGGVVNPGGTAQLARFAAAAWDPALDAPYLGVLARSVLVTVAHAAAGTALALVVGAAGAVLVSRAAGGRRWAARGLLAVPRGLHEAVWGLLLVNVLGLDPWVAVLAIGLPAGAATAQVFAALVDEVPREAYRALLAAGAGRPAAALYGLLPPAAGGLLSYAAYRLECAVRSAVVLGMVGAGGLGYQLALSFASLRWAQVWTAVYALAALSLLAELGGRAARRRLAAPPPSPSERRDPVLTAAAAGTVVLVGWSAWYLALSPASLVSAGTAEQLAYLSAAAWPPATDGGLLRTVAGLAVDTVQVSVLAVAVALPGALLLAGPAARAERPTPARRVTGALVRGGLLLLRTVPAPVWALVALFVLRPGVLPGALALAAGTLGVLGRLAAEVTEELDPRPRAALAALGARPVGAWLYGVAPRAAGPVLAHALHRWEVAVRDTVLVGLLGAGGLGALLATELATFDWAAVTTVLAAVVVLTWAVDVVSDRARAALR